MRSKYFARLVKEALDTKEETLDEGEEAANVELMFRRGIGELLSGVKDIGADPAAVAFVKAVEDLVGRASGNEEKAKHYGVSVISRIGKELLRGGK